MTPSSRLLLLCCSVALSVRAEEPANEYESGYHFAPQPPAAPPRAVLPSSIQRQPPSHEPMAYAALHGVSLETDEDGTLRVGGKAQDGYESLYFDPAATSTVAPASLEANILVKKRVSRSSREKETHPVFHDSTKVVIRPLEEMEGSGEDITVVDVANEHSQPLIGLQTEGVSFVWNQETARRADQRKEGTATIEQHRQQVDKNAIGVAGGIVAGPPAFPKVGIRKLHDNSAFFMEKPKRKISNRIGSTAIVTAGEKTSRVQIPYNRVGGTADLRGKSRRGLRRGRGGWPSRKVSRAIHQSRIRKNVVIQKVVIDRVALRYLRRAVRNDRP